MKELLHKTVPNFNSEGKKIPTGGEALAMALQSNRTLTKIDLSWNQMGPQSAVLLGEMLSTNTALKWLSLAYNSLQDHGVQEIFSNLLFNETLTYLDVSRNQFGPAAVCVLSRVLRENENLLKISLEGNAIEELGHRALVRSLRYSVPGRDLRIADCSISARRQRRPNDVCVSCWGLCREGVCTKCESTRGVFMNKSTNLSPGLYVGTSTHLFDHSDPVGYYKLDMRVPYNQAIVSEMYYLASYSSCYFFKKIKHDGTEVRLKPRGADKNIASTEKRPRRACEDEGEDNKEEDASWRFVTDSIYATLGPKEWLEKMAENDLLDCSTGEPFITPASGTLEIIFCYLPMPQSESMLANSNQVEKLMEWCDKSPSIRTELIRIFSIDGNVLARQVQEIIDHFNTTNVRLDDQEMVKIITCLAPICIDHGILEHLLDHNLSQKQTARIMNEYGELYGILQGAFCSHFVLDLSKHWDRIAAIKLAQQNSYEKHRLKELTGWPEKSGGTSQNGDWNQFRNSTFQRKDCSLDDDFFKYGLRDKLDDKYTGIVELDFVSTERIAGGVDCMTADEFQVLCETCDVDMNGKLDTDHVSQLLQVTEYLHNTHEGRATERKAARSNSSAGRRSSSPETHRQAEGARPASPGFDSRPSSPAPGHANQSQRPKNRDIGGGKGGRRHAKIEKKVKNTGSARATPKAKKGGKALSEPLDAKDMFVKSINEVRRRNIVAKVYMTGDDYGFTMESMMKWLSSKSPSTSSWSDQTRQTIYSNMTSKLLEVAATDPPTMIYQAIKVRFIHKKKLAALEFVCPDSGAIEPSVWCSKLVRVVKERPVENLQKLATDWAYSIFKKYNLKAAGAGGTHSHSHSHSNSNAHSKKKSRRVNAILRESKQYCKCIFEPAQLGGVNTVCTVHYLDVAIDGLPDKGSSVFETAQDAQQLNQGQDHVQGFPALRGSIKWRWQDLGKVEDVIMTYSDTADKVKRIKAKLGTKVLSCEQVAWLASMFEVTGTEYVHTYGDRVRVLRRNTKGILIKKDGRVRTHNDERSKYCIVMDDGSVENNVAAQAIVGSIDKKHFREEIIIACFSRVKDLENFGKVLRTLPTEGILNVAQRLGWLNIFDPMDPDFIFDLNMKYFDHRIMASALTKLSIVEKGKNCSCPGLPPGRNFCSTNSCECHWFRDERSYFEGSTTLSYRFQIPISWDDPKLHGPNPADYRQDWKQKQQACKDRGLPTQGVFSCRYITTDDKDEKLRHDINKAGFLAGCPIPNTHPNKIRRENLDSHREF